MMRVDSDRMKVRTKSERSESSLDFLPGRPALHHHIITDDADDDNNGSGGNHDFLISSDGHQEHQHLSGHGMPRHDIAK